jgi:hypothetical protein
MGFRVPLTSATAVDTRTAPTGAGARLYEATDANGVWGVLEFDNGIPGETPSTVTGRSNAGAGGSVQGGSLAMQAGSFNSVAGPRLSLDVAPAATSGYEASARLSGLARLSVDAPVEVPTGALASVPSSPGDIILNGPLPTDFQPQIRAGTAVVTAASSGAATVNFSSAFPNGVITVVCVPGDIANNLGELSIYAYRTNGFDVSCHTFTGAAAIGTIRINYLAIGW